MSVSVGSTPNGRLVIIFINIIISIGNDYKKDGIVTRPCVVRRFVQYTICYSAQGGVVGRGGKQSTSQSMLLPENTMLCLHY